MKARVLAASLDPAGLARIEEAAQAIAAGGLVAFPTETVYGIACNSADPQALERLMAVKGRPADKPFSLHVGRKEDAARHAPTIPSAARKLMARYWPGPLTIVFPTPDGRGVGIRMPSSAVAQELLKRAGVPVVAPSANRSGDPPATTADAVARTLGEELDIILDGGRTVLGEASTVVRVAADGSWEVLREGSVAAELLRRTLGKTIVFVCTANSCRSPMAEVLCKRRLAERLGCSMRDLPARGYNILSAGTAGFDDGPASYQAVEAMKRQGLDLSRHVSRPVTPGLVEDADQIFVMAWQHGDSIRRFLPDAADKIRLMDPTGRDVEDPVGGSVDEFVRCAELLERCLRVLVPEL
ncbi:MAG TPA: L-threonylcarbamoyladenylate synthase [Planctomycetota bacterium]|nr:L-threonylcarbamoyladenylate synthase [Planctomycetota bacterium]